MYEYIWTLNFDFLGLWTLFLRSSRYYYLLYLHHPLLLDILLLLTASECNSDFAVGLLKHYLVFGAAVGLKC